MGHNGSLARELIQPFEFQKTSPCSPPPSASHPGHHQAGKRKQAQSLAKCSHKAEEQSAGTKPGQCGTNIFETIKDSGIL